MSKDKTFTFRLPAHLRVRLDEIAWQKRLRSGELLRQIVEIYLSEEGKKTSDSGYLKAPF